MGRDRLLDHVSTFFKGHTIEAKHFVRGPINRRLPGFGVLVVQPTRRDDCWRYVSNGARDVDVNGAGHEYVLEAPVEDDVHLETLAMVASFHANPRHGGVHLGRILEIGRPWMRRATCDHLLVSLPYTLGADFEWVVGDPPLRILWLLAITKREAEFAWSEGVEALEQRFEDRAIDTLDPRRRSVV